MIRNENLTAVPMLMSIGRAVERGELDDLDGDRDTTIGIAAIAHRTIREADECTLAEIAREVRSLELDAMCRLRAAASGLSRAEDYRVALALHLLSWLLRDGSSAQ